MVGENRRVKLARLVEASEATASTRKRSLKIEALAEVFREVELDDAAIAVGLLRGRPRQGKIGVGWATLEGVEAEPTAEPSLTIGELDAALDELAQLSGAGVEKRRRQQLAGLLGVATEAEQEFIRRLLIGELRQGALEGLVTDAVADGADVAHERVRRALMLTGDLGETARIAVAEGDEGLRAVSLQLLRPLKPMLAASSESVEAAIVELGEAFVEWKLDGARIQAHRLGEEVRILHAQPQRRDRSPPRGRRIDQGVDSRRARARW